MKQTTTVFTVDGVFCPKCVERLHKSLDGTAGLDKLSVSYDFEKVTIIHDADVIKAKDLQEKIESIPEKDFKVLDYCEE